MSANPFAKACREANEEYIVVLSASSAFIEAVLSESIATYDEGIHLGDLAREKLALLPDGYEQEPALRDYGIALLSIVAAKADIEDGDPMPMLDAVEKLTTLAPLATCAR